MNVAFKKICFISHNATRTGAPIVLYNFIKWLKEKHKFQIETWFIEGGEMLGEFELLCTCNLLKRSSSNRWLGLTHRGTNKLFKKDVLLETRLKGLAVFDLLFFNTIASFKLIPLLPKLKKTQCIAYLHEQPFSINAQYHNYLTKKNLNAFRKILTVSDITKKYLVKEWGIADDTISIIPPFVNIKSMLSRDSEEANTELVPVNSFNVGGCGLQDWRKGPDLFIKVASLFKKNYPGLQIKFTWIGGESSMTSALEYELDQFKLKNDVTFTGAVQNPSEWFNQFDVFLLTSREDPFPLVVIEACAGKIPVICFRGIGDITNLVKTIPENVVDYCDIDAMAERILFYYENKNLIAVHGTRLQKEIRQYDTQSGAPKLYEALLN